LSTHVKVHEFAKQKIVINKMDRQTERHRGMHHRSRFPSVIRENDIHMHT